MVRVFFVVKMRVIKFVVALNVNIISDIFTLRVIHVLIIAEHGIESIALLRVEVTRELSVSLSFFEFSLERVVQVKDSDTLKLVIPECTLV